MPASPCSHTSRRGEGRGRTRTAVGGAGGRAARGSAPEHGAGLEEARPRSREQALRSGLQRGKGQLPAAAAVAREVLPQEALRVGLVAERHREVRAPHEVDVRRRAMPRGGVPRADEQEQVVPARWRRITPRAQPPQPCGNVATATCRSRRRGAREHRGAAGCGEAPEDAARTQPTPAAPQASAVESGG